MLDAVSLPELLISLPAVRVPALLVPSQLQLIMQQPNGATWIRVCAKQKVIPTLQGVHQYDSALKLVTDNGHAVSEEIYNCIVAEYHKHAKTSEGVRGTFFERYACCCFIARVGDLFISGASACTCCTDAAAAHHAAAQWSQLD